MLRQVVLTGTGRRAQLNGYTAAGKTGTAWKFDSKSKSVDSSKYISSFIGMAPAENPEIVVAVVMDEPKVGARDGGMVSAPGFSRDRPADPAGNEGADRRHGQAGNFGGKRDPEIAKTGRRKTEASGKTNGKTKGKRPESGGRKGPKAERH